MVEIITAVLAVHAAASAITALTPTPKDDEIVARIYKVIELFAGVVGKAKQ
jgi:hypothetical protein